MKCAICLLVILGLGGAAGADPPKPAKKPPPPQLHLEIHASPMQTLNAPEKLPALPVYKAPPLPASHAEQDPWWAGWEAPTGPGRAWPDAYYGVNGH